LRRKISCLVLSCLFHTNDDVCHSDPKRTSVRLLLKEEEEGQMENKEQKEREDVHEKEIRKMEKMGRMEEEADEGEGGNRKKTKVKNQIKSLSSTQSPYL